MRNVRLGDPDGAQLPQWPQRQTALKRLAFERCHIHEIPLQRYLDMPKALTRLVLRHVHTHDMADFVSGPEEDRSADSEAYMTAIRLHRESLQVFVTNAEMWQGMEWPILDTIDVRGFPQLRKLQIQDSQDRGAVVEVLHDGTLQYERPP